MDFHLQLPKAAARKTLSDRDPLELQFEDSDRETACSSARLSDEGYLEEQRNNFMNYKPAYSAQEFQERVCGKLDRIYQSYEDSAQRYEAAIKTT